MKSLSTIIDYIDEEMCDAEKYIKYAAEIKDESMAAYNAAVEIANEEIRHAEKWHDVATAMINKQRILLKEKNITIPAFMEDMWKDEHKEYIEKLGKIKYMLEAVKR